MDDAAEESEEDAFWMGFLAAAASVARGLRRRAVVATGVGDWDDSVFIDADEEAATERRSDLRAMVVVEVREKVRMAVMRWCMEGMSKDGRGSYILQTMMLGVCMLPSMRYQVKMLILLDAFAD